RHPATASATVSSPPAGDTGAAVAAGPDLARAGLGPEPARTARAALPARAAVTAATAGRARHRALLDREGGIDGEDAEGAAAGAAALTVSPAAAARAATSAAVAAPVVAEQAALSPATAAAPAAASDRAVAAVGPVRADPEPAHDRTAPVASAEARAPVGTHRPGGARGPGGTGAGLDRARPDHEPGAVRRVHAVGGALGARPVRAPDGEALERGRRDDVVRLHADRVGRLEDRRPPVRRPGAVGESAGHRDAVEQRDGSRGVGAGRHPDVVESLHARLCERRLYRRHGCCGGAGVR